MRRLCMVLAIVLLLCAPALAERAGFDDVLEGEGWFFGKEDGGWMLCSADGTPLLDYFWSDDEFSTSSGGPFAGFQSNGLGILRFGKGDDALYGCIDREGAFVLGPAYQFIGDFDEDGVCIVRKHDSFGLMNDKGEIALNPEWGTMERTSYGAYVATDWNAPHYFTIQDGKAVELEPVSTAYDMTDYDPHTGAKTPALDEPASLRLTDHLPCLDGATALFPLYSGLVQAVYPEDVQLESPDTVERPVMAYTNTVGAYDRLINGECDLIFVAQPSDDQRAKARAAGVELELTPIALEAFVFFVSPDNPLDDISVDQIRSVYSGQITTWDGLDVPGIGEIVAYQRPKSSGSQTALEKLMGDVPLMDPPTETIMDSFGMSDIVSVVEYRNIPNAIGYSFRFFVSDMMESNVKLLSIDGVAPTEENIANGSYPIIAQVYAASLKGQDNPNVQAVIDWLRSDQGKELIRRSGYVPFP